MALNFYRYINFVVFKSVTFENFQIILQIIIDIKINTFSTLTKNFKSYTFENYTSFVPVEVQSHSTRLAIIVKSIVEKVFLHNSLVHDLGLN